ncbi:hypothetical protein JG688_00005426 [Phytophthora aleatoria]|uniref:EF-hand domain-containing protein n=1 Tax=Phytophthora aleatoria TaxID=2496075 RepID=A0A8J5MHM7_9STRA|nr:hypothetical protein JG688_00005426 [Phytophthora aleatoria]
MSSSTSDDPDGHVVMAVSMPTAPTSSTASAHSLPSRLLSVVAAGELPILPDDVATSDSDEALDALMTPFLPLMTRLQSSRRTCSASHSLPNSTALDATLLRVENASKWRQYAQVFADLSPSQLQSAVTPDAVAAFRRFERGSADERVRIVLCEWLLAAPGSLESSELFFNEIYQEEVAAILVLTLASLKLQTQPIAAQNPLSIQAVTRKALAVPVGPILLSRVAVNDPSCVEQLMDAIMAVVVETTTTDKTMAQQEQDALSFTTSVLENAHQACVQLAKLSPLYVARLREKLSEQTASLHCAATTLELLTTCTREDVSVFMYQWLKRGGAPGSALRTYLQLASREIASGTSEFQQDVVKNLTIIRRMLLDTLDTSSSNESPYELTAALSVCVGLQVLGSFVLTEPERIRLLQSLDKIATTSSSSRTISLAFVMVVLLWYPLAPALSKAPGQRDEHTKTAVTLSQQVLVSLFQARDAGAGPLFVVSAVLFYTKAPALVPFLASVIGFDGDSCSTGSTSAGCGVQVQQALRAEYLHIFGDVVLKPILTENLLAREVLTFAPVTRVSTLDALSSGHGQHELTLRGLHGLLCERSFLRHHHGHRLESWLVTQIGEQAALPVHPLLVSVLLEWIENYVMAFEYPIAQAPRQLQLSIVPLRSSTLAKWLATPCLERAYDPSKGQEHESEWTRGVLGLTYALQFNQRLRHATMVAGSKLSSLVSTSSVASGVSVSAALGPSADICLYYDLSAFPLRNIVAEAVARGDKGGAFEYVAPTLLRLMVEEHPQLFDAATASVSSGSTLQLLPLASSPRDVGARDLASSWFRRRRKCGELPTVRVLQSPPSWTAVQTLLSELQSAPIEVVMRELPVLVDGFLPYAVVSSPASSASCRQVAAFCSQLAALYETRARHEQGPSISLLMRLVHALCFPDVLWRQQQAQTHQAGAFQLLTYMQVLEEPFRLVEESHDGVFCQPALLRVLLGLVRDVRAAANVHVSKCDPSSASVEGSSGSSSTSASVQQHQLLQDCLLMHGLLKRLLTLSSEPRDHEVAEESRAQLCGLVNELLAADAEASSPSPPRLVLAIHTQGYDATLVSTLVANVPSMKLLWEHWMAATSSSASGSSSSRSATPGTKPLMEFVAEGAEKDLPKWRFRLRVVLSLCAAHLSGSRQSAAMQQALRVVWNKIRNGVGSSGESSAGYVNLLSEILPWIVDACSQNADLSAELVHFLLKLQRQQQSGSSSSKGRDATGATPEDSDDEVIQLKRLNAHLSSTETVEEWIRSYQLERGNFASFAVFTEVKLDEVQETYVEQAGRPNAVEAAACCATLLKMPGIVGCYKTLLEKMSAGIQAAIYLPQASLSAVTTDSTSPDAMAALVQSFYSRTPYFERVRELEKTLLTSRSITDPNVLKAVSIDDVARIFQYVPFAHVQAGLAKVYATNWAMLDQLVTALQDQQGLLLLSRRDGKGVDDPDYPVHVPLVTSAQICRAITHNAATFSSSGRDMILCAIVDLVEPNSFRDVYQHFDIHGKMCFLHHLSVKEGMDQLELVVDALPNAGESLFRLYLATCSGRVGDLSDSKGLRGELSPKDVFFSKLLSSDMEFFFISDLAAYLTEAQWHLLSKAFEKNENGRKARKQRRTSVKTAEFSSEAEDTNDRHSLSSTSGSTDHFQMIMMSYLRRQNFSSAQVLQLVANTFLSMLEKKEFSQLFDSCWAQFPLDSQWTKALAVVQDLGNGTSSPSQDVNHEHIAAVRLKMLKKIFMMLTREERATWMDRINVKYPTESYKKKIQDLKDAATAALNTPPDLSDPSTHISRMKAYLRMRWLEAILECMLSDTESSERLTALKKALQPFADGKMPLPPTPPQEVKPTLASVEEMLNQLSAADRAALLARLAPPPIDKAPLVKDVVDRAVSPVKELEQPSVQVETSTEIQKALRELLDRRPESQVIEILQHALEEENTDANVEIVETSGEGQAEQTLAHSLSRRLKRRLTAVTAVAEPIEWHKYVKVGCLDVGCQTAFESEQESSDTVSPLGLGVPHSTPVSGRETSRVSISPTKTTPVVPLTLNALLGKNVTGTGGKGKKERYQKINSVAVPRAISGLITSWRMNTDQLVQFAKKSLANVLKIIGDAYSEMLTATKRKAQQQRLLYATPRGSGRTLTLSQIVYQSFLHSYGLPSIADMHLLAFSCAVEVYRSQHLRVEYFARFCFEEVPKSELTNYLEFLECIVSDDLTGTTMMASHRPSTPSSSSGGTGNSRGMAQITASKRSRFVPRLTVPDKENWLIPLDRAQEIAQLCFRDMRKTAVVAFCENLAMIAAQGNSTAVLPPPATIGSMAEITSGDQVLNVDHLLQLVVAEWHLEQVRRERHLLDAFRAGDVNGDGQLTSAEFTQIVLSIDASRDMGDILLMYSDTLRRTECDQLNPDIFLQVAREHELDRVVWQGDGDLFGVVNEVTDMEATWAHVRGFFVGTLEALARDLPSTHFLRVCEGAGCGCLKCLLDGYVGFQKMRRDSYGHAFGTSCGNYTMLRRRVTGF